MRGRGRWREVEVEVGRWARYSVPCYLVLGGPALLNDDGFLFCG